MYCGVVQGISTPILRVTSPAVDVNKMAVRTLLVEEFQAEILPADIRTYKELPGAPARTESAMMPMIRISGQ